MKALNEDEKNYIGQVWNRYKMNYRIFGSLALLITAGFLISANGFSLDYLSENMGQLSVSVIITALCILLGLLLVLTSFSNIEGNGLESLSGTFEERTRRRKTSYYIGNQQVIIPPAWKALFQRGTHYAVEVYPMNSKPFPCPKVILRMDNLPDELPGMSLEQQLEDQRWIVKRLIRVMIFALLLLSPVFIALGAFSNMLNSAGAKGNLETIVSSLMDYLQEHPDQGRLISFFINSGAWLVIPVLLFLLLFILFSRVIFLGLSTGDSESHSMVGISTQQWMEEYRKFYEDQVIPLTMGNPDSPTAMSDMRKMMETMKIFRNQYKSMLSQMAPQEKKQFKQDFKELNRSFKGRS